MNEKPRMITGYLIDVMNETHGPCTIEDDLQSYYDLLDCELIDMPTRRIGAHRGRYYTIVCDDEGLFVDHPKISAIDDMGQPMLVGNLFIVKTSDDGYAQSLDENDIRYIRRFVQLQATHKYPRPYPMLHQCEYA